MLTEDMDGDGNLDIVVQGGSLTLFAPRLSILWGDGRGHFSQQYLPANKFDLKFQLNLGDVDGDGDIDILMAGSTGWGSGNELILNMGGRAFSNVSSTHLPSYTRGPIFLGAAMGDIDGDGDLDIVSGFDFGGGLGSGGAVWENDGLGHFTDRTTKWGMTIGFGGFNMWSRIEFADVDQDGDLDFISRGGATKLMINHGNRFVDETSTRFQTPPAGGGGILAFEDTDQDGDLDVFVVFGSSAGGIYYRNDGKGFFTEAPHSDTPMFFFPLSNFAFPCRSFAFHDVDGDGDRDLLAPMSDPSIHPHDIFLNDGNGRFSLPLKPFLPLKRTTVYHLIPRDFDGDGDVDIVRIVGGGVGTMHDWFLSNTKRQIAAATPAQLSANYDLDVYGDPGLVATVFVSAITADITIPPFGRYGLDPATSVQLTAVKTLQQSRKVTFSIPVPNDPNLIGLELHSQAALLDTQSVLESRFTNIIRDVIQK